MQETQVQSPGPEDLLEEGIAAYSSILAWRIPQTEEPGGYSPYSCEESDTTKQLTLSLWLLILDNPHKHASCLTEGRKESDMTEQLNWTKLTDGMRSRGGGEIQ